MKTGFFRAILTIAAKDLRAELRSRQLISAMGLFALLATMVFYFTLESRADVRISALPAVVWVIVVFAGTLGISRNLSQEHDRGTLDALLLAPIDRAALFYGKLIGTWLFSIIVALIVSVALVFFFNADLLLRVGWWLIILLGTLGISSVGTLLGSMAIHSRGRETTLPILVLPVALPILMAAVTASNLILADRPFEDWAIWPLVLASLDAIMLAAALILFDFIVEE